jgi:hypothetical protein
MPWRLSVAMALRAGHWVQWPVSCWNAMSGTLDPLVLGLRIFVDGDARTAF